MKKQQPNIVWREILENAVIILDSVVTGLKKLLGFKYTYVHPMATLSVRSLKSIYKMKLWLERISSGSGSSDPCSLQV